MGPISKALLVLFFAIFVALCAVPPLSQIIYRAFSDIWPPARASKVFNVINGGMNYAALKSGLELGVFELLAQQPRTAAQVASELNANERGVGVLLEYLSTLDLISSDANGVYHVGGAARAHLLKASPDYVGGLSAVLGSEWTQKQLQMSKDSVIRGGADPALSFDGMASKVGSNEHEFFKTFAQQSVEFSMQPANSMADVVLANIPTLASNDTLMVLDVACGSGTYGFVLAQRHTGISITSLDQASVVPYTREWAKRFDVADRTSFIEGSVFDVQIPAGQFDVVLVSHMLHQFDGPTNVAVLKRIVGGMKPGAVLVINDFIKAEGMYSPWKNPQPFQFGFTMLITTEKGSTYTETQFIEMLSEAGLTFKTSQGNFPLPNTYVVATLPVK